MMELEHALGVLGAMAWGTAAVLWGLLLVMMRRHPPPPGP